MTLSLRIICALKIALSINVGGGSKTNKPKTSSLPTALKSLRITGLEPAEINPLAEPLNQNTPHSDPSVKV